MAKIDLKNFIIPTTLSNTDADQNMGDSRFDTRDLVFLDSADEIRAYNEDREQRRSSVTDWALVNGAFHKWQRYTLTGKEGVANHWLRSANSKYRTNVVGNDGDLYNKYVKDNRITLCPALRLNLSSVISARSASGDIFKIGTVENSSGSELYHTIEFGEYPKTYVGNRVNEELEKAYYDGDRFLKSTGKKYLGHVNSDSKQVCHEEFEYRGQKYVRVNIKLCEDGNFYADKTKIPEDGNWAWIKVEPITWKIRNWDEMPRQINPRGNGSAKFIDVRTEEAIACLPFYPNDNDSNISFWQNSTVRGYLNGINVNNIRTNGNIDYTAPNGGDFSAQNFLMEALDITLEHNLSQQQEEDLPKRRPRKGYGVKVLDKPMTVNEQIKFYIETGKSFMLHGPSGVGKTRRIEEADPDFVSIVLRNGILPEEVIGKTIYPNNDKTKAGTWVPPAWYVDLCEKCEREPDKQHVLFIDEITNVKPSEQSLVFHLVLNNSIGPNIGKLPQNVVVAAAGNSKEESEAAYNMPEPLFRRFDGHIELRPDVQLWLEWGSEQSDKGEGRLKVHPLVANFVGAYGSQVFYSPYDSEDPPKYAIDPRGWEQVSDIIYDNKGLIARELIENKVGKEIAATFVAFAQTPPLMVEDVIDKNYDYSDIPGQFDAKYALALSLRSASIDEIQKVREFINIELGGEILSMFDLVWVGDDNEKAIHLASLPPLNDKKQGNSSSSYSYDEGRELPF